jgi:hypothetical protein
MAGSIGALTGASSIEKRARRIGDPVARLKYLRSTSGPAIRPPSSVSPSWVAFALLALAIPQASDLVTRRPSKLALPRGTVAAQPGKLLNVWPVEQTKDYEVYSNGLRIEDEFAVANEPRIYQLIARDGSSGPQRSAPAGIVFHTTESDQAPFEVSQNHTLQRIGRDLLLYLRQKRAYHFLIDRFGRVHRIVIESDAADHAGHSAWADSRWLYLGLNESFLGVAFEAQMQVGAQPANEAQIHAAKVLIEMLRAKYNLPAEDCVLHAQVSFNPGNMHIGWHTDWGSRFPFAAVGLPNNYTIPTPLIYAFGLDYDGAYRSVTGPDLWNGLTSAEQRLGEAARKQGVTVSEYRKFLQKRFRELSALRFGEPSGHPPAEMATGSGEPAYAKDQAAQSCCVSQEPSEEN